MFNPTSSAVPPDCISKTRLAPMALSTTAPGTSASMVRARSMQTAEGDPSADPVHMLLVSSYVPATSKILLTALLPSAAMRSLELRAYCEPGCSGGKGGEGGCEGSGGGEGGRGGSGGGGEGGEGGVGDEVA